MLSHLRTEAYPVYKQHQYPPSYEATNLSYEHNNELIDEAKEQATNYTNYTNRHESG
jgi:hypothetical protein